MLICRQRLLSEFWKILIQDKDFKTMLKRNTGSNLPILEIFKDFHISVLKPELWLDATSLNDFSRVLCKKHPCQVLSNWPGGYSGDFKWRFLICTYAKLRTIGRDRFWTQRHNLNKFCSVMVHAKYQSSGFSGFWEEDFFYRFSFQWQPVLLGIKFCSRASIEKQISSKFA